MNISNLEQTKLDKIEKIKEAGFKLFPNTFEVNSNIQKIKSGIEEDESFFTKEDTVLKIAGRIMAVNKFGKASFIRISDRTGKLQVYLSKKDVGEDKYNLFKYMDIGDFIGVSGFMFRTRTKEWTLFAKDIELVTKSKKSLPEKFHGLKNTEKRYRKRYLDLIVNDNVKDIFIKRSKIIQNIREFLIKKEFIELETPMMHKVAGGAEAEPFITHHNALDMEFFLRIAPELYLKRLVVGGFERVFEINRNFRNEGVSTKHNPEFTMVEFYMAYKNYEHLMNLTEELFNEIAINVTGGTEIVYQDKKIDFGKKWRRIKLLDSLVEIGGVDPMLFESKEKLYDFAKNINIEVLKKDTKGKLITKLFDALVEPNLIQPTFITHYPVEVSPLSRKNDIDETVTDRFELFIDGKEIANGFSEINDPDDQKDRFLEQLKQKEQGDKEAHSMDEDYIEALSYGMPPTAGEGIGIDRVAMLFTDSSSIREVILFPLMK